MILVYSKTWGMSELNFFTAVFTLVGLWRLYTCLALTYMWNLKSWFLYESSLRAVALELCTKILHKTLPIIRAPSTYSLSDRYDPHPVKTLLITPMVSNFAKPKNYYLHYQISKWLVCFPWLDECRPKFKIFVFQLYF